MSPGGVGFGTLCLLVSGAAGIRAVGGGGAVENFTGLPQGMAGEGSSCSSIGIPAGKGPFGFAAFNKSRIQFF